MPVTCQLGTEMLNGPDQRFVSWLRGGGSIPLTNLTVAPRLRRSSHGFSILEMMMVVVMILIIASISMPYYERIIMHGHEAVLREDLFTMRVQIDRFTHDYERGPATLQELVDKGYMGTIPADPFTGSNQTWQVETADPAQAIAAVPRSDGADRGVPAGIIDVHSGAEGQGLDGTDYTKW